MAEPRATGEIYGHTFDEVFRDLIFYVNNYPDFVCSPRGQKIKECLAQTLVLEDPRARLINNPARKANYGFAAGEFLWYWQGREDLEMMQYYNKRSASFSNDGKTINSAYGKRMRRDTWRDANQWDTCVKTLVGDTDSRRALLLINAPIDNIDAVEFGSKDVPCTLSLQFFIRKNRLHVHIHMRSNDIVWGLTNDLFSFTLFQECMLLSLKKADKKFENLELGTYYHTAGSMHLYERHFGLAEEVAEVYTKKKWAVSRDVMPAIDSLEDLDRLGQDEEDLRKRYIDKIDLNKYTGGARWLASQLNYHRQKRDADEIPAKEEKEAR